MVEQWTYHVLQMLTINTICSAVQLLFFSSSIDISQTSFKSQHVYRLGERCWKWLDPWRDGRSPDHLQDRRCAPLVHVSLPRSPALPHHDRRNSLNTIYTLPCPLYEVKLIFRLKHKVKKCFLLQRWWPSPRLHNFLHIFCLRHSDFSPDRDWVSSANNPGRNIHIRHSHPGYPGPGQVVEAMSPHGGWGGLGSDWPGNPAGDVAGCLHSVGTI